MANAVNLGNMLVGNEVNLGDLQIANAVSIVYTAGDNITISDDRVISAIVPTKTSDLTNDSGYITNDTDELVNYTTTSQLNTLLSEKANVSDVYTKTESDNKYSTIPETGNKIEVSIDSVTYIMSLNLKDKNNNILSTAEVDLPLESVVVNGRYDDTTKELVLTLQNGNEIRISVADLISGLQETLVAGDNIQLVGNTISATDTTYTLSGSTSGDITTLTLTGSDASTSTAIVDLTDINQDIADIQAEQIVQNVDIDDLYNLLPTVTDTGESLELNNTGSAKLKSINLGGNTSQNGEPTPTSPQTVNVVKGNNTITISNEDNSQSQVLQVNLGDTELCKIGDYQDYLYKENGKWYKKGNIGKIVLNGNETDWAKVPTGTAQNRFYIINLLVNPIQNTLRTIYSNNFAYGGVSSSSVSMLMGRFYSWGVSSPNRLTFVADMGDSLDTFKNWLSTHNTEIYYQLSVPTTTEITDTTLIAQLNNLEKARSYKTQTNITQDNTDKPFIITASAFKDLSSL